MGRSPCCDKSKVKRGSWSPEEDAALRNYLLKHGTSGNWIALPHKAGLRRCGKSCRLRWLNYLRPDIKHGAFTQEEDDIILNIYNKIGSRWSAIASQLPGRTDNDVKNHWNTKLKKKLFDPPNYNSYSSKTTTSATSMVAAASTTTTTFDNTVALQATTGGSMDFPPPMFSVPCLTNSDNINSVTALNANFMSIYDSYDHEDQPMNYGLSTASLFSTAHKDSDFLRTPPSWTNENYQVDRITRIDQETSFDVLSSQVEQHIENGGYVDLFSIFQVDSELQSHP